VRIILLNLLNKHVVSLIPEKKIVLSVDSIELKLAQRHHWSSTYMTLVAGVSEALKPLGEYLKNVGQNLFFLS
jgi:hypothetical protein